MMNHGISRREFLNQATVGAGALSSIALAPNTAQAEVEPSGVGSKLKGAGYDFKRLEALMDGRVRIEGFDTTFQKAAIGDMNTDAFSGPQSFEITEIGLHPFMLAYANEGFRDYTLLPVFPLKLFRHKSIFIRNDRGIEVPADLKGKRVATAGYSSTSLTWIRGTLQDEYGVRPEDLKWVVSQKDSSVDASGKASAQENVFPGGLTVNTGPAGLDESELLAEGHVDAVFHAAEPRAFVQGHPKVARLFTDSRAVEQAYYAKTGIFPIMHAIAIKRGTLAEYPELPKAVFDAYSKAKAMAYQYMAKMAWADDMLPWYGQELESTKAVMGENFYSYGIEPNRKALEHLFRYSYEQKLAKQHLKIEDLFVPGSLGFEES